MQEAQVKTTCIGLEKGIEIKASSVFAIGRTILLLHETCYLNLSGIPIYFTTLRKLSNKHYMLSGGVFLA